MTDTMLFGVLKMPFEMAMSDEISRMQYYARVQELVGRFEAQQQAEPVPRWDVDEDNPDSLAKHPAFQAALEQQVEPPPEWLLIKNILDEYGLQLTAFLMMHPSSSKPSRWRVEVAKI